MNLFVILAVFFLGTVLYGFLLDRLAIPHLQLTRRFMHPVAFCGEESEMLETIVNDRPFIIPWVRVESRISPYLRFGHQENLDVRGDMYHCSLFTIMPYQKIVRHHRVRFLRRGIYNIGSAAMTAGDLTGMFHATRDQKTDMHVTVFPRILDEQDMPMPLLQLSGEVSPQRQLLQDPFMTRSIRDYWPGDAMRDIHWPASAKLQKLQVKIHDYEAQLDLIVLISSQTREDQWDDLMDYEQMKIEQLISVAASACLISLRQGMKVGFAANMPFVDGDISESACFFPDETILTDEEELLSRFAALLIHRTLSFTSFLERLSYHENANYLILTCYEGNGLDESLAGLRQRGIRVNHVCLGGEQA